MSDASVRAGFHLDSAVAVATGGANVIGRARAFALAGPFADAMSTGHTLPVTCRFTAQTMRAHVDSRFAALESPSRRNIAVAYARLRPGT